MDDCLASRTGSTVEWCGLYVPFFVVDFLVLITSDVAAVGAKSELRLCGIAAAEAD